MLFDLSTYSQLLQRTHHIFASNASLLCACHVTTGTHLFASRGHRIRMHANAPNTHTHSLTHGPFHGSCRSIVVRWMPNRKKMTFSKRKRTRFLCSGIAFNWFLTKFYQLIENLRSLTRFRIRWPCRCCYCSVSVCVHFQFTTDLI